VRSPASACRNSPYRHQAARRLSGIHAVFTFTDIAPMLTQRRGCHFSSAPSNCHRTLPPSFLPRTKVAFVGEAVAVVIAQSRAVAERCSRSGRRRLRGAAGISDCQAALRAGAALAHRGKASNLLIEFRPVLRRHRRCILRAHRTARGSISSSTAAAPTTTKVVALLPCMTSTMDWLDHMWSSTQLEHEVQGSS